MVERFHTIEAKGVWLTLDTAVGHVRRFEVERDGTRVRPLHTAPWVDDPAVANDPSILPNLKFLAGDFFCAPFGKSDVEDAPPHGWPANSEWKSLGDKSFVGGVTARFELGKKVMGATLIKAITLRDGHPFEELRRSILSRLASQLITRKAATPYAYPKARVWCAAVATGQEAYSVAMAVTEFAVFL